MPPAPRSAGEERWSFRAPGRMNILGEPLSNETSVFFTQGDTLHELDRETGRLEWSTPFFPRSGWRRLFRRRLDDFESRYGVPLLSLRGDLLVVSHRSPEGALCDSAFDVRHRRPHPVGDLEDSFDPLAAWGPGGIRLAIEEASGKAPVLRASDARGALLWDSHWVVGAGLSGAEWIAPTGRPVAAGNAVVFGIREASAREGRPSAYRLYALRLDDGSLVWERPSGARDFDLVSTGYDHPHFWTLTTQRDGVPLLRLLDAATGKTAKEARFPGLTGGAVLKAGILYAGFGRSFLAVALTL